MSHTFHSLKIKTPCEVQILWEGYLQVIYAVIYAVIYLRLFIDWWYNLEIKKARNSRSLRTKIWKSFFAHTFV